MILEEKQKFIKQGVEALGNIYDVLYNLESFDMDTLEPEIKCSKRMEVNTDGKAWSFRVGDSYQCNDSRNG